VKLMSDADGAADRPGARPANNADWSVPVHGRSGERPAPQLRPLPVCRPRSTTGHGHRPAAEAEQKSTSAPGGQLTWPPVRESTSAEIHRPVAVGAQTPRRRREWSIPKGGVRLRTVGLPVLVLGDGLCGDANREPQVLAMREGFAGDGVLGENWGVGTPGAQFQPHRSPHYAELRSALGS
jgi:hypothetical protein